MQEWQLQEAKARLSEVVKLADLNGPQAITVRGKPSAIVLSQKTYEQLTKKPSFIQLLKTSPLVGVNLKLKRDTSPPRDVDL